MSRALFRPGWARGALIHCSLKKVLTVAFLFQKVTWKAIECESSLVLKELGNQAYLNTLVVAVCHHYAATASSGHTL